MRIEGHFASSGERVVRMRHMLDRTCDPYASSLRSGSINRTKTLTGDER
jgi:hypothetical protein